MHKSEAKKWFPYRRTADGISSGIFSDFMISYGANGNSRVILNENEEIIEYLVYDRLSENEKCELYVLYRSKKNTDGSWYISEAEILDIFAYSMSTKDVVSSGKTSWSATGSEEHEIN